MTVRGIEAINLYMPTSKADITAAIKTDIREERGRTIEPVVVAVGNGDAMTSVERYRQEWIQLLDNLDEDPESLRLAAFNGQLKMSKFRSIHWALLLRVLNVDHRSWHIQRTQQRSRYDKFRLDYVRNPHELAASDDDDPLSQSTQSVWNQYFSDQELFGVIRQDVVRTFPGVEFFRKALIQNAMTNILFYYAREHPYMCYRQGMHEILAPIIFVLYSDHQSLLHFSEIAKTDINETLLNVLDTSYLEADTYSIFSRLMASVESYYRVSTLVSTAGGYIETHTSHEASSADNEPQSEVEVISQLNFIRDKILAKQDQHLHHYLLKMEIPLHIFGIRWLRLLFGREFMLLDLLMLWDAIFADSDRFDLPNYILVAMLVHIREKLLLSDYTTSLTYLMRYPSDADVNLVLRHALHMLNPKQFEYPTNAFNCVSFTNHLTTQTHTQHPPASESQPANHRVRTSSETSTIGSGIQIDRQITYMQARNAADSSALAKLSDVHRVAMDGYLEDSPELLRLELKNAQTVIKIARGKLVNYLSTVRQHMGKQPNEELNRTLDGIEELCSFLDVKFVFPLHARSAPIDQAHEANERKQLNSAKMSTTMTASPPIPIVPSHSTLPLSVPAASGYEVPENAFMHNSTRRLLGDRREIELSTITSDERPESMVLLNGLPAAEPQQRPQ
ncbi:TBC1 domain family member 5 [Drosophila innubila]|uniref:TBC1 domain family member 5 n=1 Tax=Drosophila innubila TaxID=198719 RepID=UPI00148D9C8B|nr:TBC1 domain family member 5 [Drosophila innubila]